jgi:hypothetical protein
MRFAKLCFPRKQIRGGMLQDFCQRKRIQEEMLQVCAVKGSAFLLSPSDLQQSLAIIFTSLTRQKEKLRPREEKESTQVRLALQSQLPDPPFLPCPFLSSSGKYHHLSFCSRSSAQPWHPRPLGSTQGQRMALNLSTWIYTCQMTGCSQWVTGPSWRGRSSAMMWPKPQKGSLVTRGNFPSPGLMSMQMMYCNESGLQNGKGREEQGHWER